MEGTLKKTAKLWKRVAPIDADLDDLKERLKELNEAREETIQEIRAITMDAVEGQEPLKLEPSPEPKRRGKRPPPKHDADGVVIDD